MLERYHLARDADILPMYDFTVGRLEASVEPEVWQAFARRTWDDPALARQRVAAMAHAVNPAGVYAEPVVRALAAAETRSDSRPHVAESPLPEVRNR
jgi:hypothetical protein